VEDAPVVEANRGENLKTRMRDPCVDAQSISLTLINPTERERDPFQIYQTYDSPLKHLSESGTCGDRTTRDPESATKFSIGKSA